jgi:hypothetical protein
MLTLRRRRHSRFNPHTIQRRPMPILGGIVLVSILLVLLLAFMGVMS